MADYVDGDEQLQDAFEEGNGDANNDEVRGPAARLGVTVVASCPKAASRSGARNNASQTRTAGRREEENGRAHCMPNLSLGAVVQQ